MGINPKIVVRAVIKIGRNRCMAATRMACSRCMPEFRYWLIKSIKTMALFTTTPISTTNPIPAMISKVVPVAKSSQKEPTKAAGIATSTENGRTIDSNNTPMIRSTRIREKISAVAKSSSCSPNRRIRPPVS